MGTGNGCHPYLSLGFLAILMLKCDSGKTEQSFNSVVDVEKLISFILFVHI